MWGQVLQPAEYSGSDGIIPTRVGTSFPPALWAVLYWDHPHACGDKVTTPPPLVSVKGSSPRVWGQDNSNSDSVSVRRIIPTRMGTSKLSFCEPRLSKDHPHAYGDKPQGCLLQAFLAGSSPRVWGQESCCAVRLFLPGIIPTRMGTSAFWNAFIVVAKDHPHAYGDKKRERKRTLTVGGSSPRVWGQDGVVLCFVKSVGIIPTRMGTSA